MKYGNTVEAAVFWNFNLQKIDCWKERDILWYDVGLLGIKASLMLLS